jgi:diguanylate cyclase (GGDEF)-like protein
MPKTLRVLLVEDDPDYAVLVRILLDEALDIEFDVIHVESLADARIALLESPPECMLVDLTLPDARWLEAPHELHSLAPEVPLVILSGLEDETLAMKAVHEGAQDYLVKGHANGHILGRSIRYAIERRQAENESAQDSMYDALTGLPNRNLFVLRLQHALRQRSESHPSVVVLFVGLENLTLINETIGRPVGKRLLKAVGMRLRAALPELGGIGCFGSGLFGLLRETTSSGSYRARTIDQVMKSFEVPFVVDAETVFVTACVGIAVSGSLDSDDEPEELIRQAEADARALSAPA